MTRRRLLGMGLVTAAAGAVARFVGADDKASQAPTRFEIAMSDAEWAAFHDNITSGRAPKTSLTDSRMNGVVS